MQSDKQASVLALDDTQLYELTHAIQSEYVKLHKHIADNPNGMNQAIICRAGESRKALSQVFDKIMVIKPDWVETFKRTAFIEARLEAES